MSGMDGFEQYVAAVKDLRELVREAHEVTKDLRQIIREGRELRKSLPADAHAHVEAIVEAGLEEYKDNLATAIDKATEAVNMRFDLLSAILLGEDPRSYANGRPSIPEYIDAIVIAQAKPATPAAFLRKERKRREPK